MRLSYDENIVILDLKYIPTKRTGYSLNPKIYEVDELNNTLEHILPDNVKASVTIDDIGSKSNLKINQTLVFTTEIIFLYYIRIYPISPRSVKRYWRVVSNSTWVVKSEKPINMTGVDKVHLKCDCIEGSILNGIRTPILYSFTLSSPPGHKIDKEPNVKPFKKVNKSVLSHITFYLENDDYKPVDFHNETITFTCQLIKI